MECRINRAELTSCPTLSPCSTDNLANTNFDLDTIDLAPTVALLYRLSREGQ